jgi:hypothetical protein
MWLSRTSIASSRVKLQVLELVGLDPDIIHDPQAADALHELLFLEGVSRARHDVDLHATSRRSDEPLDDDHVLKALVPSRPSRAPGPRTRTS